MTDTLQWWDASNYKKEVVERYPETSALVRSGIIQMNSDLSARMPGADASMAGLITTCPIALNYNLADENMGDTGTLTYGQREAYEARVPLITRAFGFSDRDLKKYESGMDPLADAAQQANQNVMFNRDKTVIKILEGLESGFASGDDSDLVVGTSSSTLNYNHIIDVNTDFGDTLRDMRKTLFINSKGWGTLQKADGAAASAGAGFPSDVQWIENYGRHRVVVSDNIADGTGYMIGDGFFQGAFSFHAEMDRDIGHNKGEGQTRIANRHFGYLMPQGFDWTGGVRPTDAQFATGTNWKKAYSDKRIVPMRIFKFTQS